MNEDLKMAKARPLLALILLIAAALRLIALGDFPYWHDEVHNLVASEDLYGVLVHGKAVSNHPPLPYILVAIWRAIGLGGSEFTMRLLPMLAGLGGVASVYFVGSRLLGRRVGLAAAALLALSPFHIHHSQELKEYIYLPTIGTLMAYSLYRATETNRTRHWSIYAVLAGLSCYTELFVAPMLVAINLWFLATLQGRRDRLRPWIVANVAGALLFVPQLWLMLIKAYRTMVASTEWWVPPPSILRVLFYLKTIAFGYSDSKPYYMVATAVFFAAVAAGTVVAWRKDRRIAYFLCGWFVIPVVLVYIISLQAESVFLIRSMLPYAMPVFILAGAALVSCRPRILQIALGVLLVFLPSISVVQQAKGTYGPHEFPHRPGVHPPMDTKGATSYVLSQWQEGDVIVHTGWATWLPFYWYGFRNIQLFTGCVDEDFIRFLNASAPPNNDDPRFKYYFPIQVQKAVEGKERVWIVFSEWEREYLPSNPLDVWRWMDAHYTEVQHRAFRDIEVFLYDTGKTRPPVRVARRDNDNGVQAELTFEGSAGVYTKTPPDWGLISTPPESREGDLVLRFDDPGPPEKVFGADAQNARLVAFSLQNQALTPVKTSVNFLPSDGLLSLAGMFEVNPDEEVWSVRGRFNPQKSPDNFEMHTACAKIASGQSALEGHISLPPGEYAASLELLGIPGDSTTGRASLELSIAGQPVLKPGDWILPGAPNPFTWSWRTLGTVRVPDAAAPLLVRLNALGPERENDSLQRRYEDLSYMRFHRIRANTASQTMGTEIQTWPGEVALQAGEQRKWTALIPSDSTRYDVWVYEKGADGKSYHVFSVSPDP